MVFIFYYFLFILLFPHIYCIYLFIYLCTYSSLLLLKSAARFKHQLLALEVS